LVFGGVEAMVEGITIGRLPSPPAPEEGWTGYDAPDRGWSNGRNQGIQYGKFQSGITENEAAKTKVDLF